MRIFHLMSRTIACAALAIVFATAAIAVVAAAQTQGSCPPIIASLLPKNGSIRDGQYFKSGEMGFGSGSADIPFEHRCLKSTKFPARISIKVTYYGGELVEVFKMQGDAPDKQFIIDAMSELKEARRNRESWVSAPKREKLTGGEIAYFEYKSECPPKEDVMADVGEMIVPNVKLRGITRTENARMEVTLEGSISVDAAKAAVTEVFENLQKADFSKAK